MFFDISLQWLYLLLFIKYYVILQHPQNNRALEQQQQKLKDEKEEKKPRRKESIKKPEAKVQLNVSYIINFFQRKDTSKRKEISTACSYV